MSAGTYAAEQPEFRSFSSGRKWLSDNDDKAWAERLYLWFIPLFFLISGIYSRSAWANSSSLMNLMQGVMLWLPYCVILPLVLRRGTGVPFYRQWWFRFQLYVAVIVFLLSYFGTEYFFDVLGMRYRYEHLSWYLDSALLGPDQASALVANKRVPLGMYPTTMAFFTIYHITAIVFVRRIVRATQGLGVAARRIIYALALFAMACFFAFAETLLFMSAPSKTAWYIDLPTMLTIGTLFYSMDFIFTFPSIYRLDEDPARAPWSLGRIVIEAAAACMGALLLADLWTLIFGAPFA
jgi:cycloeucalenol cycloisomerase